jgi:hypothetical protein
MRFIQKADTTGCAHRFDGPTRKEDGWEMGLCSNCHNQVALELDEAGKRTGRSRLIVFRKFAVVGHDLRGPQYLGYFDAYEDAVKLQENMATIGWKQVEIVDAALQKVTEKP